MKAFFTTACILILTNLAKASDLGLDVNSFGKFTKQNNVVAMNGTGTCDVIGELKIKKKGEFENFTLKQLREKINQEPSVQRQQEILDLIERTLLNEKFNQN